MTRWNPWKPGPARRDVVRRFTAAGIALVLLAPQVLFADPIDEKREVDADARISIKNLNGSVIVEGWKRNEVVITGDLSPDAERLDLSGSKKRLRIEVVYPRHMRHMRGDSDLELKVPIGSDVRVSCVNARIEVSKTEGELELETVNGNVEVTGKPRAVEVHTVNGRIQVSGVTSLTDVATVGGRILLDDVRGEVRAETVGGPIRVSGGDFERAEFTSVSGDIDFDGKIVGRGSFEFETHNGDVTLRLPGDVSAEFDISTFNGDIDSEIGPRQRPRRRSKWGPGREMEFVNGDGDAEVRISTFNGDVRIEKKR